jgi:hypothetical protein
MKKIAFVLALILVVIAVAWYTVKETTAPTLTPPPTSSPQANNTYTNSTMGFSLDAPEIKNYTVDEAYVYPLAPDKEIKGTKFTVTASMTTGTNLSSDTYMSVETLPSAKKCTADLFLDGTHEAEQVEEGGTTYSIAEASGVGAGNRYEETVYALVGTNPCMAVRYFVHYGVIQNYPEGTIREFDKNALLFEFDMIRRSLRLAK